MSNRGASAGCSSSQQHGEPNFPLAPTAEEDPNVLIAEDDGMEVDADAKPEEEGVEPFGEDHGDDVSDIDSDHYEE